MAAILLWRADWAEEPRARVLEIKHDLHYYHINWWLRYVETGVRFLTTSLCGIACCNTTNELMAQW